MRRPRAAILEAVLQGEDAGHAGRDVLAEAVSHKSGRLDSPISKARPARKSAKSAGCV